MNLKDLQIWDLVIVPDMDEFLEARVVEIRVNRDTSTMFSVGSSKAIPVSGMTHTEVCVQFKDSTHRWYDVHDIEFERPQKRLV